RLYVQLAGGLRRDTFSAHRAVSNPAQLRCACHYRGYSPEPTRKCLFALSSIFVHHPTDPSNLRCSNDGRNMFGVVFPDRSFPMDVSSFTQIDPLHWVLDMNTFVGEAYQQVKEVCIFLLNGTALPPGKALAVYVQAHGNPYTFCGAIHTARPSAVLHLSWPDPFAAATSLGPPSARIGVSVEDLVALPPVADAGALGRAERLALRVGENLFNFMQSFCTFDGNRLIVPADILDRWFNKFQERSKRDPDYLKGFIL
ncbi:hypothetical protein Taro_031395, partial [Colocasia esculenta]|nr:hypothetical protein [Colocasia esculenta]